MQVAYAPSGHGPVLGDREEPDLSVALDEIDLSQPLMFHVAGIGVDVAVATPRARTRQREDGVATESGAEADSTGETALDSTILHGLVHP